MLANGSENRLTHLLGAYNSDSDGENDEEEVQDRKHGNNGAEDLADKTMQTDWTQCFDRDTGHPYFWNIRTKDVQWEMPQEYSTYLDWVKRSVSVSEHRWKVYEADDTKVPYYVDEVTRIVSWEMPDEYRKHLDNQKKTPMVKKNTPIERKAQKKPKKKYPEHITKYNSDDEKIELISSYGKSSDSSEESDTNEHTRTTKSEASKHSAKKKVVHEEDRQPEKVSEQIPSVELLPYKLYDPNDSQATEKLSNSTGSSTLFNNETSVTLSELEKTYKMGSKSPENPPLSTEMKNITKIPNAIEEIDVKLTMRKRRIEIPRIPKKVDPLPQLEQEDSEVSQSKPKGSLYANFQSGGVEFTGNDDKEANVPLEKEERKEVHDASTSTTEDEEKDGEDLKELSTLIGAKVKFLSEGRPIISGVQIMQIQLETLVAAYEAQHLTKYYIMNWLNTTTKSLQQLEKDVAPNGWRCKWDRANSRYYYQSLVTGKIQWDFPEPDVTCAGDEMELCTTPPPHPSASENEEPDMKKQKLEEHEGDDELRAPEPPTWNSSPEPPPAPSFDTAPPPPRITDKFNMELDSFYSDLATLDSPANPSEAVPEVVQDTKKTTTKEEPELVPNTKMKKKKVKASRTDLKEVSLMMAKWQKAQQDLKK